MPSKRSYFVSNIVHKNYRLLFKESLTVNIILSYNLTECIKLYILYLCVQHFSISSYKISVLNTTSYVLFILSTGQVDTQTKPDYCRTCLSLTSYTAAVLNKVLIKARYDTTFQLQNLKSYVLLNENCAYKLNFFILQKFGILMISFKQYIHPKQMEHLEQIPIY